MENDDILNAINTLSKILDSFTNAGEGDKARVVAEKIIDLIEKLHYD